MRIGLVGYGRWGQVVARAIARTGELAVIIEPDLDRRVNASATWEGWGTQVRHELAEWSVQDIDAVWIATPTVDHLSTVQSALSLGLHVLCEKPFVLSKTDAARLVAMAKDRELALQAGHLTLHMGRHLVLALRLSDAMVTCKVRAVRRNTEASLSDGSVLAGIGPHEISPLVDLLGLPNEVSCVGTAHRVVFKLGWEREPGQARVRATVELDWLAESRERLLLVDGESVEVQDDIEPTVAEAQSFIANCLTGAERQRWYDDAVNVTEVLARLEAARTTLDDG